MPFRSVASGQRMNADTQVTVTISAAVAVIAVIWRLATKYERARREFQELQAKVGTMWEFQLRRGKAEAEQSGIIRPVVLTPLGADDYVLGRGIREAFETNGLGRRIRERWRASWMELNEHDLTIAIEKEFGPELLNLICVPLGIHSGACLHAAAIMARKHESTEVRPDK